MNWSPAPILGGSTISTKQFGVGRLIRTELVGAAWAICSICWYKNIDVGSTSRNWPVLKVLKSNFLGWIEQVGRWLGRFPEIVLPELTFFVSPPALHILLMATKITFPAVTGLHFCCCCSLLQTSSSSYPDRKEELLLVPVVTLGVFPLSLIRVRAGTGSTASIFSQWERKEIFKNK